jgi:1-acyl-sn-glycerol-3-phosphate acyltransferase
VTAQPAGDATRPRKGFWFGVVVGIVKPLMVVFTKRDWRGAEHLPKTGGVVVVANHISHVDPFAIGHYLYDNGRIPRMLGKASLFKLPVLGRIITNAGQIPVYRGTTDAAQAFRAAVAAVERGECVMVYPEATITKDPALWPMIAKTGAARIALTTGCPVIPVAQWGPQEIYPPYGRKVSLLPRKTMHLVAGPPVDLSAFQDKPITGELLQQATAVLMWAIADQLATLRGEAPPAELYDVRKVRKARIDDGEQTDDGEESR